MLEIEKHEQYDEIEIFGWDVQEIIHSDNKSNGECYIIIAMTDSPDGFSVTFDYWFCFIEYRYSPFLEGVTREQIISIDCDWFKTECIGSGGVIIDWQDWEK